MEYLELQGQQDRTEYQGHRDNQGHQDYQAHQAYQDTRATRAIRATRATRVIRTPGLRSAIRSFQPEFSPVLWMFDINIIAIEY